MRSVVVDNASSDASVEVARGLGAETIALDRQRRLRPRLQRRLAKRRGAVRAVPQPRRTDRAGRARARSSRVLRADPRAGAARPRILEEDGSLALSQRRFPRLRTTLRAGAVSAPCPRRAELDRRDGPRAARVRAAGRPGLASRRVHARPARPRWSGSPASTSASSCTARTSTSAGACARSADSIRYEPTAVVRHEGGASAPQHRVIPVLAASRVRYARKHHGRASPPCSSGSRSRLHALTHALVGRGGPECRAAHLRVASRPLPAAARPMSSPRRPSIVYVVGARPNFVKMAPVVHADAAARARRCATSSCTRASTTTARCRDVFFDELGLAEPDHLLGVGSGAHGAQTARCWSASRRCSSTSSRSSSSSRATSTRRWPRRWPRSSSASPSRTSRPGCAASTARCRRRSTGILVDQISRLVLHPQPRGESTTSRARASRASASTSSATR